MEKREKIDKGKVIQDYLSSNEEERDEKGINIITDLCEWINILESRIAKMKRWGEIKRKFFVTKDLLDKLLIIENFIADNKIYIENINRKMEIFFLILLEVYLPFRYFYHKFDLEFSYEFVDFINDYSNVLFPQPVLSIILHFNLLDQIYQ